MREYILKTNNLTKRYKKQKAVDNVSLNVEKGSIYGFIGRNGAGKTTFLKMISGLAEKTSGDIELFGHKGNEVKNVYDRIGVLIEAPGLYPNMTAFDNLKLKAICMGIYKKNYIREIIECVGLGMVGNKKVKNFSLGMKQRLGIGMALIGEPDLLVLDEPINGLDPQGIVDVRETIMKLNRERNITIIISSHILEELSKLVTHYGIIDQGSLVEELTKEELYEKCSERIEVALDEPEKACTILDSLKIHNYKVVNSKTIHIFERLEEVADINMEFSLNKIKISSIGVNKDNLEKYFMDLTGGVENA
ncbi:MAG: transporter related [Clostridiales bacterium]|jgi:ABC-2 type transport system ATP-binding protein|nr:transporter related [Clostridiales bacterium]